MEVFNEPTDERFSRRERLFSSKTFRYAVRIFILYVFSLIFKSFDLSFIHDLSSSGFRSFIFSFFYVGYGLIVWEGAVWLAKGFEKRMVDKNATKRLLTLCGILIIYGALAAFGFGFIYASTDILMFEKYEAW